MSSLYSSCHRLIDYFLILELDGDTTSEYCAGKVLQRFPENDWSDIKCIDNIDQFCLPGGWQLFKDEQPPRFYVAMLTDQDGAHSFCASLVITELSTDDFFSPKAFVLLSQHPHVETFRKCLTHFYQVYTNDSFPEHSMEKVIGKLLGNAIVPSPGTEPFILNLPYGDKIILTSPKSPLIPLSGSYVSILFRQIGISNMLSLVCAMLTDRKIVLVSSSYSMLIHSSLALNALIYPFTYIYVFIPILPIQSVEVVQAPSPFLLGVHRSYLHYITDADDVIFCDIDASNLKVPLNNPIDFYPEPFYTRAMDNLLKISKPDLFLSDNAFQEVYTRSTWSEDKELRSVFVRIHAELLFAYNEFICIVRILPSIVVALQKYKYKLMRGYIGNEFMNIFLDSPIFDKFLTSRGIPYRVNDIFDEVFYKLGSTFSGMLVEDLTPICVGIARKLLLNESRTASHETPQTTISENYFSPKSGQPKKSAKLLNNSIINAEIEKFQNLESPPKSTNSNESARVKYSHAPRNIFDTSVGINKRRIQVTKNCLQAIFDCDMFEARKTIPAVLKIVYLKATRTVLCDDLTKRVADGVVSVNSDQFTALVSILKSVLKFCVTQNDFDIAGQVLLISRKIYRSMVNCTVSHDVVTCLQEYPSIWYNLDFWLELFYQCVEGNICEIHNQYLSEFFPSEKFTENAMDIAEHWLRNLDSDHLNVMTVQEDTTVLSQLKDFANLMVTVLVPFNLNPTNKLTEEKMAEISRDLDCPVLDESITGNFRWNEYSRIKMFITNFVDFISNLYGINNSYSSQVLGSLPYRIQIYMESYELWSFEYKKLQVTNKHGYEEISLFDNETIVYGPIGATHKMKAMSSEGNLEGYVVLTNYRIVFKGFPVDPNAQQVCSVKSIPIGSIFSEKKVQQKDSSERWKIKTTNFQLLDVTFGSGVSSEQIESLKKSLTHLINFTDVLSTFPFSRVIETKLVHSSAISDRLSTLRKTMAFTRVSKGISRKNTACDLETMDDTFDSLNSDAISLMSSEDSQNYIKTSPLGIEFQRLGFTIKSTIRGPHMEIVTWNSKRILSKSYPVIYINPSNVLPLIPQISKSHVNGQYPIVTWTPKSQSCFLMICSSYIIKSLIISSKNMETNSDPRSSASSKYLAAILDCTCLDNSKISFDDQTIQKSSISGKSYSSLFSVISPSKNSFKPSKSSVYLLVPKSSNKSLRLQSDSRCHMIAIDISSKSSQRNKFNKLIKITTQLDSPLQFRTQVEDTGWLMMIKNIITIANVIVYLMITCQSTVILSLESSGSDYTTQVSTLAQIMMDPFYRTFEGFQALVEKDWLSFGHRFPNNVGFAEHENQLSPIFTVFLDCIHQIMDQFPLSFQYNDTFLRFVAYHHVSNRFQNFMQTSMAPLPENDIWTFIKDVNMSSLVFTNLYYDANSTEKIIRPFSEIYNLDLWEYYIEMNFSCLPIYELVVKSGKETTVTLVESYSLRESDEPITIWNSTHFDPLQNNGAIYYKIFDDDDASLMDTWNKCTIEMDTIKLEDNVQSISNAYHELVCRSVLVGDFNLNQSSTTVHNFIPYSSIVPVRCVYCHQLSINQKNILRCDQCNSFVHMKCMNLVTSFCGIKRTVSHQDTGTINSEQINLDFIDSGIVDKGEKRVSFVFGCYLSKKGFANRWQKRYFAYDNVNHHMVYYLDDTCSAARGCIDLSSVNAVDFVAGPGNVNEELCFEMTTQQRTYNFLASNVEDSRRWMEIISGYIR